ncbi:hypothetical protein [Rhizobium leguminosarum]|nr:hypothetical protein [Rhizobium leguminosarum]
MREIFDVLQAVERAAGDVGLMAQAIEDVSIRWSRMVAFLISMP